MARTGQDGLSDRFPSIAQRAPGICASALRFRPLRAKLGLSPLRLARAAASASACPPSRHAVRKQPYFNYSAAVCTGISYELSNRLSYWPEGSFTMKLSACERHCGFIAVRGRSGAGSITTGDLSVKASAWAAAPAQQTCRAPGFQPPPRRAATRARYRQQRAGAPRTSASE